MTDKMLPLFTHDLCNELFMAVNKTKYNKTGTASVTQQKDAQVLTNNG